MAMTTKDRTYGCCFRLVGSRLMDFAVKLFVVNSLPSLVFYGYVFCVCYFLGVKFTF